MTRLLTAQQVCDQFGVPSVRTVRTMRQQGLAAVRLGKAYLFDPQDVEAFIETTTRIYAHHHPDFMQNALDAADRRKKIPKVLD